MKKQEFLADTAGTFQTYIYENNRKIVPTSATLTVYEPNSETVLINAQAMGVDSDGLLTYSLTTTHNETVDENYHAEVTYVFGGNTFYTPPIMYDVVYSILTSVITDDDVVQELPQITGKGYRTLGVATSGSTTTIVDSELQMFPDDYFTGGLAESLTQNEKREITASVSSTGTVTTTAFPNAVSTDKYMLTRSYTREIDRALDKIRDRLQQKGRRHALILDSADLKELHLMFTIALICKSFVVSVDDVWDKFYKEYKDDGDKMFRDFKFKYDGDEDGFSGSDEENKDFQNIRSVRA